MALTSAMVAATVVATPNVASAATGGCYGASCNGLNPSDRCDGDARTVAAKAVKDGMLELRWSPSCVANWGRYTPYDRTATTYAKMGIVLYARVTTWNSGKPSVGTAYHALGVYGSSWSQMVDGRTTACTGVEVRTSKDDPPPGWEDSVWNWGPCY